jgi:EAL domain-containing protein (putative c-di-GMP-specific phosphodiesterase class I)
MLMARGRTSLCHAFISLGHAIGDLAFSMGMKVIAEGVETGEQLALLRSLGCHYGQGFLFDQALSPEEAEQRRDYSRLAGPLGIKNA